MPASTRCMRKSKNRIASNYCRKPEEKDCAFYRPVRMQPGVTAKRRKKFFFMHSFRFYGSQHDLKPGDNIDIHVQGERAFAIEKAPGARELLARLRKYRGRLPADFKFDRLEANERG
jgi:antitoxin MazE